ncbi:hypothetical protein C0995_007965 [Termitomyces sp. Mi166|nr:hypothetical protein C0995_007965 [Termitomyces sp. Mi166\
MSSARSWQGQSSDLRELLSILGHVTSFSMRGATVHDDLLDDIASGTLLPNVRRLSIRTPTFAGYMSMVERRLRREQGLGKVKIDLIKGSAPERIDERVMRRLKEVGEKHGTYATRATGYHAPAYAENE